MNSYIILPDSNVYHLAVQINNEEYQSLCPQMVSATKEVREYFGGGIMPFVIEAAKPPSGRRLCLRCEFVKGKKWINKRLEAGDAP